MYIPANAVWAHVSMLTQSQGQDTYNQFLRKENLTVKQQTRLNIKTYK